MPISKISHQDVIELFTVFWGKEKKRRKILHFLPQKKNAVGQKNAFG
jgi:hypothetical protein